MNLVLQYSSSLQGLCSFYNKINIKINYSSIIRSLQNVFVVQAANDCGLWAVPDGGRLANISRGDSYKRVAVNDNSNQPSTIEQGFGSCCVLPRWQQDKLCGW